MRFLRFSGGSSGPRPTGDAESAERAAAQKHAVALKSVVACTLAEAGAHATTMHPISIGRGS